MTDLSRCIFCGNVPQGQAIFTPRWIADPACVQASGLSPEEINIQMRCCDASRTLHLFDRCVVQYDPDHVPEGQAWFVDPVHRTRTPIAIPSGMPLQAMPPTYPPMGAAYPPGEAPPGWVPEDVSPAVPADG